MTGQGESAIRDVLSAAFERDGRAGAEGLSEAEAFGRFAQDIARGLGAEGMVPPAFLEAYKAAEGMSTTERPLPQSEPHMQAMTVAAVTAPTRGSSKPRGRHRQNRGSSDVA